MATFADVILWSWFDLGMDTDLRIKYSFANDFLDEYDGNLGLLIILHACACPGADGYWQVHSSDSW